MCDKDDEAAVTTQTRLPLGGHHGCAIEGLFLRLTTVLKCEVNTLGYPPAALFGFCVALAAGNVHAAVKAAVRAAHGAEVADGVNAYLDAGLDGLRPRKPKGKAGHIPASLADEVKRWVIDGPAKQGLDRANWTHEEIADHLLMTKGIRTSRGAVQRFCSGIGIRLYRPSYRYDRGDPVKQARARQTLADLGNGRRPVRSSC